METVVTNSGSLAATANSLTNLGSAGKAFVLIHPLSMAAVGGDLLGISAYHAVGKALRNKGVPST